MRTVTRPQGSGLRTTQNASLKAEHICVVRGGQQVVHDASFVLEPGEVLGLIGPNGAGKSSTIGGLLGFYPLTDGEVTFGPWTVSKQKAMPPEMKRQIAYIPEQPMYYTDLTLAEHFEWKLRLYDRGSHSNTRDRLSELCERFQLEPHLKKFPHQCSKGTLQKMMVVSAFLLPFDVLVVDEPFIGLDVIAIREIRRMIEQARMSGAAILVSTHVLDSAERMCGRFAFMVSGHVFATGTLAELREVAAVPETEPVTLEDLFLHLLDETRKVE